MTYKILLVEDHPQMQEKLQEVLENMGHEVETANNGAHALRKFDPIRHELVITGLSMPEMDGIQLAKELFERQARHIILCSIDFTSTDTVPPQAQNYVNAVMRKSAGPNEMRRIIEQVMAQK